MSLRNRARRLQRATGWTYQQALAKLRALGVRPAELARETGWPLWKCDLHLCGRGIEVVEAFEPEPDPLTAICQRLLAECAATAVWLFGPDGPLVAHAGRRPSLDFQAIWMFRLKTGWPREERAFTIGTRRTLLTPIEPGGLLVVQFGDDSSLGLVRVRVARVKDELERLLRRRRTPILPPTSRGGPGGLPAQVRVALVTPAGPADSKRHAPSRPAPGQGQEPDRRSGRRARSRR